MTSCLFHPNPSVHVVEAIINIVNLSLNVAAMQKNLPRKSEFKSVIVGFAAGFSPASSTGNGALITVDSEHHGSPRNTGLSTIRPCSWHLPED